MEFFRLATTGKLVEAQLISAIRDGAPARAHAALLQRSTELTSRLEAFVPRDQTELEDMVGYFVRRASILQRRGEGQRELQIAIDVTNRFRDTPLMKRSGRADGFVPTRPLGGTLDPAGLVDVVMETPDRVAVLSPSYRILAASSALAKFHRTSRMGLFDLHLADVVGIGHFQSSFRGRLDACFDDVDQDYEFTFDDRSPEARRLRCQMQPIRDRQGRLYCATIQVTDADRPMPPDWDVATTACL